MDKKKKALIIAGSIGTCGLVFLGYKLYRFGFDAGVKYVGEKLFNGELTVEEEDENGKLGWKCPNCGNTDQNKMNVARRTCGYIGTQFWNQGRTQEIKDRVLHL